MAALVKYAASDSTKDPESDEEKADKGKKSGNAKGQHNSVSQGGNGKRKVDDGLDFVEPQTRRVITSDVRGKRQRPGLEGRSSTLRP